MRCRQTAWSQRLIRPAATLSLPLGSSHSPASHPATGQHRGSQIPLPTSHKQEAIFHVHLSRCLWRAGILGSLILLLTQQKCTESSCVPGAGCWEDEHEHTWSPARTEVPPPLLPSHALPSLAGMQSPLPSMPPRGGSRSHMDTLWRSAVGHQPQTKQVKLQLSHQMEASLTGCREQRLHHCTPAWVTD